MPKLVLLIFVVLNLASCMGKKEVKYYPESIPPFLSEEFAIEEVFTEVKE